MSDDRVHGHARRVLDDVKRFGSLIKRFGSLILPPPDLPVGTEEYRRVWEDRRRLSERRLDEAADRLCLPVAYFVAVLVKLEDRDLIDWRTGGVREGGGWQ